MTGLILKDIYSNKKQFKLLAGISLIYLAIGLFAGQTSLFTVLAVLLGIQAVTCYTNDEATKWDMYANTLPVSKKAIVRARYIIGLLLAVISALMLLALYIYDGITSYGSVDYSRDIFPCLLIIGIILIIQSIMMVIITKLGPERARIAIFIVIALPALIIMLVLYKPDGLEITEDAIRLLNNLGSYLPVVGLLCIYISFRISVSIYSKKEF